jgi:hypothetical protein
MDFTKFVSLISSANLFFCRADLFKDPFEGSYSKANVTLRPQVYNDMPEVARENMMTHMSTFSKWVREWIYISCWHANEYESAAMWDLYAKTNEAVAIETSYERLQRALPDEAHLGCVQYIDYDTEWLPEGNVLYPFMHKRKSFEHEREVRAVLLELPANDSGVEVGKRNSLRGKAVPIIINDLITTIHVAPTAPAWLAGLVAEVASKYDLFAEVKRSDLYSEPVF